MKQYVRFDDLVTEAELPAAGTDARDRYVEVLVSGDGRCQRKRLEETVPDLAAALSGINSSIVLLAEQLNSFVTGTRQSKPGLHRLRRERSTRERRRT